MELSFENSVSLYNLQLSQRSLCDRKYVLYHRVSGFRGDLTLSWVVDWRVYFALYSTIPNISELIPWCRLYVQGEYPLLVILTLKLLINMSTIKSWASQMKKIAILHQNYEPPSHLYTE